MLDILIRPIVTEKMNLITEKYNRYGFRVDKKANKHEIKKAVEILFNVKVSKISTSNVNGKQKRVGAKSTGKTSDWKKAYITLTEGKINFLDEL